jgi:predicted nucleic acid-binding protein
MELSHGLMLDTNVFNRVLDEKIDSKLLQGRKLFITHIQRDELNKTNNDERKRRLLSVFAELIPLQSPTSSMVAGVSVAGAACPSSSGEVPTASAAWDISRFDQARWKAEDNIFEAMLRDLGYLNKNKRNNTEDILIAETALRNDLVLVSADRDLIEVMVKYGGQVQEI